jgi:hypothetical protein
MLNDWYALGAVQYRKWNIYDLNWTSPQGGSEVPINLENYLVCGAPFGGPIAMIPDSRRLNNVANPQQTTPIIDLNKNKLLIFTSSGLQLAEIDWQERPVIGMGWTDHENLVVIADNGENMIPFASKLQYHCSIFC